MTMADDLDLRGALDALVDEYDLGAALEVDDEARGAFYAASEVAHLQATHDRLGYGDLCVIVRTLRRAALRPGADAFHAALDRGRVRAYDRLLAILG